MTESTTNMVLPTFGGVRVCDKHNEVYGGGKTCKGCELDDANLRIKELQEELVSAKKQIGEMVTQYSLDCAVADYKEIIKELEEKNKKFIEQYHDTLRRAEAAEKERGELREELQGMNKAGRMCADDCAREINELRDRLKTAEEDKKEAVKTLLWVIGEHNAPHDCYSSGPFHGDARDAMCPACFALARYEQGRK